MKLLYIANARIPTEKAHGLQIIKMCEAFSKENINVELILPFRLQTSGMKKVKDICKYYDVEGIFKIAKLYSPDLIAPPYVPGLLKNLAFWLQSILFALLAVLYIMVRKADAIYSRDLIVCFSLCSLKGLIGKRIYYEAHDFPKTNFGREMFISMNDRLDGLIVITKKLGEFYKKEGISENRVIIAPSGVDIGKFKNKKVSKEEARNKLEMPIDKRIVCYAGHLYKWKGPYILARSANYLPGDHLIYLVGGMHDDVRKLRKFVKDNRIAKVRLTGYVKPSVIPKYLAAADVLAVPNTSKEPISKYYTSPLKVFEYMASRRPIVASDLPSIREVLNEDNAILVSPDDPKALAEGIMRAKSKPGIVERAWEDVQQYSWGERAKRIIKFMEDTYEPR